MSPSRWFAVLAWAFAAPAAASVQFAAEYSLPAHGETILVAGHSVPCLADLDADGFLDLLVGEGSGLLMGKVRLYLSEGLPGPPSFGDFSYLQTTAGELNYPGG
jgi:hypothetical protein